MKKLILVSILLAAVVSMQTACEIASDDTGSDKLAQNDKEIIFGKKRGVEVRDCDVVTRNVADCVIRLYNF